VWDDVENVVESERPQMTIWRMGIACWVIKATNTYSQHAILITLPLQQLLHYAPHCVRYAHISRPVKAEIT